MILEIIPDGGIGRGAPIRLLATQIIVRLDDGTPVAVAAHYGDGTSYAVSMAGKDDFNRILRNLGVHQTVICDTIELPKPPPGARLIAGPKPGV
jgi:hypothetical protein